MRYRLLAVLAMLLLWGCAKGPMEVYRGTVPLEGQPAGYVVASISREKDGLPFSAYRLKFRNLADKDEGVLALVMPEFAESELDVSTGTHEGAVAALRLPPGKYEIYNFEVEGGSAIGTAIWSANQDFSIPFEVTDGKFTYVGAYESASTYGENIFGMKVLAGLYWFLSNQSERDLAALKARMPALKPASILVTVPDPARLGIPLFVSP